MPFYLLVQLSIIRKLDNGNQNIFIYQSCQTLIVKQHILDIKNFIPYIKATSMATHFNLKDHDPSIHFKFYPEEETWSNKKAYFTIDQFSFVHFISKI
ncbi:hypothetical protein BpHYR1_031171 [Brachionus plicatilis]|uniref:Uncharacterized protein n=1 Tax=Brachionus plicatilis TaxID=10195 RepID=A0A3M7RTW7_BRAPC|nr:hypothetical protein BpHYR1_031171 [Brachionus plicatilis]